MQFRWDFVVDLSLRADTWEFTLGPGAEAVVKFWDPSAGETQSSSPRRAARLHGSVVLTRTVDAKVRVAFESLAPL